MWSPRPQGGESSFGSSCSPRCADTGPRGRNTSSLQVDVVYCRDACFGNLRYGVREDGQLPTDPFSGEGTAWQRETRALSRSGPGFP